MKGILLAITMPLVPMSTVPAPVDLARFSWDAVADARVIGYKVHWGTASGTYDHVADVGNVTEIILSGFVDGTTYYAAGTSYSMDEESDFSPEITFVYELPQVVVAVQSSTDLISWKTVREFTVPKVVKEFFRIQITTP